MQVRYERHDDGVVVLTFDDPERRNAMTEAMGEQLAVRCDAVRADPDVRAVVLTGSPPAFSAGGDLDMLADLHRRGRDDGFDATATMRAFYDRFLQVRELPVPVIAAVNGHAVGAGCCVALACDLRVVANEARVGLNFARLGLHPGMGGSWLLPRVVGEQWAAAWLYTGDLVDGASAARAGFALEALPGDEVLPAALALARRIATASPTVVRQLKATAAAALPDLDAALDHEAGCQATNYGSADLAEGLAAARERRPPRFADPDA